MRKRYAAAMRLMALALPLWLSRRVKAGKEDAERLGERYGRTSLTRPNGTLIWMHGASVGETKMMLPLIKRLYEADSNRYFLITSGTTTSADLMQDQLPNYAFHQYLPFDAPQYVARFLKHWRPDLAIWMESEIWPNLILQTKTTGTPMALINARMNEKSLQGWRKRKVFAKAVFSCFDTLLPADHITAAGLSDILGNSIKSVGNLKYDAPTLVFDAKERAALKSAFGDRPLWVAASIHAEEMEQVIKAHNAINENVALILAPRHPSEAASRMIVADHPHMAFKQRSKKQMPDEKTDVYLFDTFGEMGLAFSLADIALVGGSLTPELMGHNPLEPIRLGIPTVTGPHFASFAEIYEPYIEKDAVIAIEAAGDLPQIIEDMLASPQKCQDMSERASRLLGTVTGSLDVTVNSLEVLL
jgi:3-deoxy-D-manno-octulosonic-acid transferase